MRLPFFYGWVVVASAFITMAIGVNARTAFSLLFPPILDEFGWERGLIAGAFAVGFAVSTPFSPWLGWLMDRRGVRALMLLGVVMMGSGLALATLITRPWHLYLTLGFARRVQRRVLAHVAVRSRCVQVLSDAGPLILQRLELSLEAVTPNAGQPYFSVLG